MVMRGIADIMTIVYKYLNGRAYGVIIIEPYAAIIRRLLFFRFTAGSLASIVRRAIAIRYNGAWCDWMPNITR